MIPVILTVPVVPIIHITLRIISNKLKSLNGFCRINSVNAFSNFRILVASLTPCILKTLIITIILKNPKLLELVLTV